MLLRDVLLSDIAFLLLSGCLKYDKINKNFRKITGFTFFL